VNIAATDVYRRYRALSRADRRLLCEAALLLVLARFGIAVLRVPVLQKVLGGKQGRKRSRDAHANPVRPRFPIERAGWAVAAAARRVPFRTTCLIDSVAVDAMLRRRGYASEIRFGVRVPEDSTLAAHAWVEHEGAVVFGAISNFADYSVLSAQGKG
jgi:hypothetical protein